MTVASRNNKHVYVGNGVNRIWPYTFSLPETAYMNVYLKEGSNAAVLLSPSLYTVNEASATVTYPLGDLPAIGPNTRLILLREVPYTQEIDLINQGDFYAETIEGGFDKTVMQIQQLAEQLERALLAPIDASGADAAYETLMAAVAEAKEARDATVVLAAQLEGNNNAQITAAIAHLDGLLADSMAALQAWNEQTVQSVEGGLAQMRELVNSTQSFVGRFYVDAADGCLKLVMVGSAPDNIYINADGDFILQTTAV